MANLVPVEHDPFAQPKLTPVEHDPFEDAQPGVLEDVAKSAGVGLGKGAIGLVGLPGDLANLRDAGIDKLHRFLLGMVGATPDQIEEERAKFNKAVAAGTWGRAPKALSSGDIQGAIEQGTGPFHEPQTTAGRYAERVGEFVPAALTGGEGVAANVIKGAVAPAIGSQAAGDVTEGTALETPARLAGAVLGGAAAHGGQVGVNAARTYGAARNAAGEASNLVGGEPVTPGAVARVARNIRDDALTPEAAAARVQELGPESMLLDMGRQLGGRAEAIASQPGRGQNTVLDAVENRTGQFGEGTAARVRDTLDREMGPSENIIQQQNEIAHHVDSIARPMYEEVMNAHPVVNVPENITSRPPIAQAMRDAVSLARSHGENLMGPAETRTILRGDGYHIADDVTPQGQPSLRYWDYVKKAMDARINGLMRNGGIESLNGQEKADLGGLISSRNALRDHLDQVTEGAYRDARNVAANKPQMLEALEQGRNALNTRLLPEELADMHDNMSIPQQAMMRVGMRREIDRIMDTARNDGAAARRVLDTNQNREKIATIFGDRAAREIDNRIAAETAFQNATNRISANSRTAVRQQLVRDTESPSEAAPPTANLMGFAHKAIGSGLRNLRESGMERTRAGIGSLVTAPGEHVPDLVSILAGYNQRAAANARPPIAPYANTLARVLALNGVQSGGSERQPLRLDVTRAPGQ